MRPMTSLFRVLVILAIGHAAFIATEAFAANTTPAPARLRFLFIDETPGGYALKTPGGYRSISSAPYSISAPYTPSGVAPLEIYKNSPHRDPETGEIVRVRVARLTPPTDTTSALVILTPQPLPAGADGPPPFKIEVLDCDPANWPAGSLRILNRGHSAMAAQIGTEQLVVAPGDTRLLQPDVDHRHRIRTRIGAQTPAGWKIIDDNVAVIPSGARMTGLFVFSPSGLRSRFGDSILAERGDPPPAHVWLTFSDTP